jgi:hypothetical protein
MMRDYSQTRVRKQPPSALHSQLDLQPHIQVLSNAAQTSAARMHDITSLNATVFVYLKSRPRTSHTFRSALPGWQTAVYYTARLELQHVYQMLTDMLNTRQSRMQAACKAPQPQHLGRGLPRSATLRCRAVAVTERVKLGDGSNAVEFTPLINVGVHCRVCPTTGHVPTRAATCCPCRAVGSLLEAMAGTCLKGWR